MIKTGTGANVMGHMVQKNDGDEAFMAWWTGKVLMIVNVASECGLTPQYEQLVELHRKYRDRDFEILAFPCNDFGEQEPGTDEQIAEFCKGKYDVEFELFSKVHVKGDDVHSLYAELISKEKNGELGGEIEWNFTKFIVDGNGDVVARIGPKTPPDDPEVVAFLENELDNNEA